MDIKSQPIKQRKAPYMQKVQNILPLASSRTWHQKSAAMNQKVNLGLVMFAVVLIGKLVLNSVVLQHNFREAEKAQLRELNDRHLLLLSEKQGIINCLLQKIETMTKIRF